MPYHHLAILSSPSFAPELIRSYASYGGIGLEIIQNPNSPIDVIKDVYPEDLAYDCVVAREIALKANDNLKLQIQEHFVSLFPEIDSRLFVLLGNQTDVFDAVLELCKAIIYWRIIIDVHDLQLDSVDLDSCATELGFLDKRTKLLVEESAGNPFLPKLPWARVDLTLED
jgi:hypothetical protein